MSSTPPIIFPGRKPAYDFVMCYCKRLLLCGVCSSHADPLLNQFNNTDINFNERVNIDFDIFGKKVAKL